MAARAQYVVSHNLADFPPLAQSRHQYDGVEHLTAIEFVQDVLGAVAVVTYGAAPQSPHAMVGVGPRAYVLRAATAAGPPARAPRPRRFPARCPRHGDS